MMLTVYAQADTDDAGRKVLARGEGYERETIVYASGGLFVVELRVRGRCKRRDPHRFLFDALKYAKDML